MTNELMKDTLAVMRNSIHVDLVVKPQQMT